MREKMYEAETLPLRQAADPPAATRPTSGTTQAPLAGTGHFRSPLRSVIQRAQAKPWSLTRADVMQLHRSIGNAAVGRLLKGAGAPSRTGLPDGLKTSVEVASGLSMDDVRVSFDSPRPAEVQAHAYAQGTEIHLGPGQDEHLPHEAWHIVQQKQGRVKPTGQIAGTSINDDSALEQEAGDFSRNLHRNSSAPAGAAATQAPTYTGEAEGPPVVQRVKQERLHEIRDKIAEDAESAPTAGANLWQAQVGKFTLSLLGTEHGLKIHQMDQGVQIGKYLSRTHFDRISTEIKFEMPLMVYKGEFSEALDKAIELKRAIAQFEVTAASDPNYESTKEYKIGRARALQSLQQTVGTASEVFDLGLDNAYAALASKLGRTPLSILEDEETRLEARHTSFKQRTGKAEYVAEEDHAPAPPSDDEIRQGTSALIRGDQKATFKQYVNEMAPGLDGKIYDKANAEERNEQWLRKLAIPEDVEAHHLWIVGAFHLPGLIVRLKELGWNVQHQDIQAQ